MSPFSTLTCFRRLLSTADRPRPRRMWASQLERLEDRTVPAAVAGLTAGLAGVASPVVHSQPQAQTLGSKMGEYLARKVGTRLGGGECADMATAALRATGADFTRTEAPGTQDYVWTTNRVARITDGSQAVGQKFRVGDIIQLENATFRSAGSTKLVAHHTQVVAAVDSQGRITKVYEQNVNGDRTVRRHTAFDLRTLAGGSVGVYRPVARVAQAGLREFTIVNHTKSAQNFTIQVGTWTGGRSLTASNTAGSFQTGSVTFSGSVKPMFKIGNFSVEIRDGAAYELYTRADGAVGIRRV